MTGEDNQRTRARRRLVIEAVIGVLVLAAFILTGWYVQSPQFNARVRARIVARLEQMTGGRVELKSMQWNLRRLQFDLRDVTIHGLEGQNEVPYAHADRVFLRAKVISLLERQVGLQYLELDQPVLHLIVYPDGTTNQPVPKSPGGARSSIEDLFDLAVNRAEIKHGVLLVNDHKIPLDASADNVALTLKFARNERRYDGGLRLANLQAKYNGYGPMAADADVNFGLWRDRLQLRWIHLTSGASTLQARGEVRDFAAPTVTTAFVADIDLKSFANLARTPRVRGGMMTVNGEGTWTQTGYSSSGKLTVRNLELADRGWRVSNTTLGAEYTLDSRKVVISHLFASLFGGTATGGLEIANWSSAEPDRKTKAAGRKSAAAEPTGVARLQLHNLLVSRMATAVSTRSFPLDRANLVGTATGTVDARWQRSLDDVVADISLDVAPPSGAAANELPVTAVLRGQYRGADQQMQVQELSLGTRATRLNSSGVLGSTSGNLDVDFHTTDLGEWKPLLVAFGGPGEWPFEVHGRALFNGTVIGKFTGPRIAGRAQVADFDTLIAPATLPGAQLQPASAAPVQPTQPHRVHWDTMTADIDYSPTTLAAHNAELTHGNAQIRFDFSGQLKRGKFTETSPFTAQVNVHDADLTDVLALGGYSTPVTGNVNFTVHASGTQTEPQGHGSIVLNNAHIYGEPFQRISSDIEFRNHEAQFTNLSFVQNGGSIRGTAGYNLTSKVFHFDVRGSNLSLARIERLQNARASLAGSLAFTASGSGTTDAPAINANIELRNLVVNGEKIGELTVSALTTGDTLKLSARSNPQNPKLMVDGTVRMRADFPAELQVRANHLDIDPLLRAFLKGRVTAHSSIGGTANVKGPLRTPRALNVAANIEQFSAEMEHIAVRNEGPITLTMADGAVRVQQVHVVGEDTDLTARGRIQLAGTQTLDTIVRGRVNLKVLQTLYPELVSYGSVSLNVRIGGELSRPLVNGEMDVANAAISYVDLPNGLSDINGRLVFNQDRLQVVNLTGRTGGGTLDIGGFITYGQNLAFNLSATGRDLRLRYPPGVSAMANANLRLTGTMQSSLLSGDVTIIRFGVNPQFDFSQYLTKAKQPPGVVGPESPLSHLRMDVHIVSTPELQVQTSLAKISGDVDLRLRGTANRPVVIGRVNIVEGDISFNGTKYRLERGDIVFTNPVRIDPVLDMQATTTVRNYDITIGFHGPIDKLTMTYRSDPPLATADIVSLLAFGRTREESAMQTSQNQNLPETASYAILNQALSAAVSSRMQKIFGVSRIKIDPQTAGVENNITGPAVTIEQQVANKLTITYISNLSRANYQTIQAEYNVNRNVSIIATRDWNGVVSFDVRIRQRKR